MSTTGSPHPWATTPEPRGRRASRYALATLLGGAAVGHLVQPRFFEALVPDWVPGDPRFWNLSSGAAEATAAVLLTRRSTSRLGGALALATLLVVYPANVQAAIGDGTPGVPGWGGTKQAAIARLPLQAPPVWAAWRLWRRG